MRKFLPLILGLSFACNTQPSPDAKAEKQPDAAKSPEAEPQPEPKPEPETTDTGMLGSKRSETCKAVMSEFASLSKGEPAAALAGFALAYRAPDSKTAAWVQSTDKAMNRVDESGQAIDHVELLASLDQFSNSGEATVAERTRIDVVQRLDRVAMLDIRRKFERIAKAGEPDGMPLDDLDAVLAEWDDAWCLWDGTLRPLAQAIDTEGGELWEEQIVEAFIAGRAGLTEKYDAPRVRSNREIAEKSTYAVIHRLVLLRAGKAKEHNDARLARVASGMLGVIEERLLDRNGPGVARVQAMLKGPPAEIDVDMIERELDKGFVKRARKYCDEAIKSNLVGQPEGIKGSWEGLTYTKLLLPGMRDTLAEQGFDPDAYLSDWEGYIGAIENNDASGAAAISERLVQWNCAYQEALGITECSSTSNEPS